MASIGIGNTIAGIKSGIDLTIYNAFSMLSQSGYENLSAQQVLWQLFKDASFIGLAMDLGDFLIGLASDILRGLLAAPDEEFSVGMIEVDHATAMLQLRDAFPKDFISTSGVGSSNASMAMARLVPRLTWRGPRGWWTQNRHSFNSVRSLGRKVWINKSAFKHDDVVKDIIAPDYLDDMVPGPRKTLIQSGATNQQLMSSGYAPFSSSDGLPVQLHHTTGREPGTMTELTSSIHTKYSEVLHRRINKTPSFRNEKVLDDQFEKFRSDYWKQRAIG